MKKRTNFSFKALGGKNWLKFVSISALLFVTSCSNDEKLETSLESSLDSNLSINSVLLPISSSNIIASTSHTRYPVENAFDGDLSTRWTGNGIGTTLEIDLEREDLIDYIKIAHYRGDQRVYDFKVYTKATEESEWNLVGTKVSPGNTNDLYIYDLSNSVSRYIMIESNGNTSNNWSDIVELEVYGTIGEVVSEECVATVPETRYAEILTNDIVVLNWTAIPNIDHYNLRYKKIDETGWTYIYSIETNVVSLTGVTKGEDYEWQVRSKCADGSATDYNDATSYFTTTDEDDDDQDDEDDNDDEDDSDEGNQSLVDGTFTLDDFQIETSWLTGEDSRTTQSFVATEIDNEEWYDQIGETYVLTSLMTDGNRTEWKEYPGIEASLQTYKNMQYKAVFENIPENGVTIAQVHNRGGVNRPLLRVYIHEDNKIYIKVTDTTPDEDSSEYTTLGGIDYVAGSDVELQILIQNGEININVETGGELLSEQIVPSSDWDNYSDSYYLKAGVYTEGNDVQPKATFDYFVVEK